MRSWIITQYLQLKSKKIPNTSIDQATFALSLFGLVSKEKYAKIQKDNERLKKSLKNALDSLKKTKAKTSDLSERIETLSQKNIELANAFHTVIKERDQLKVKAEKYREERQLLQNLIQELNSLARKRRRKVGEAFSPADSFDSDIERLLNKMSREESMTEDKRA